MSPPLAASEPAALGSYRGYPVAVDNHGLGARGNALRAALGARGAQVGVISPAAFAHVVEGAADLAIGEGHQQAADDREVLEREGALERIGELVVEEEDRQRDEAREHDRD